MASLSMKEVLGALQHVDVIAVVSIVLASTAMLLAFVIIQYSLFTWVLNRKVQQVRRKEEKKRAAEHGAALEHAVGIVSVLKMSCNMLESILLSEQVSASPVALEIIRPFMTELLALEKVLDHLDRMLDDGIVPERLEFFQLWYDDLRDRFEEGARPRVLSPLIIEAIADEAEQIWRDTITFTATSKQTLLECLQESMTWGQRALAEATRTLARSQGSDAGWKAAGEYRKSLIHFAACAAIRLVLKHKKGELDLHDPQVVESHFVEFERVLAQKCNDDQIILAQALRTRDERSKEQQILLLPA